MFTAIDQLLSTARHDPVLPALYHTQCFHTILVFAITANCLFIQT